MMNQGDLFNKIGNILNELQDQYQNLDSNPQIINELQLDLFLANANFLTEHVQILMKINQHREVKMLEEGLPEPENDNIEVAFLNKEKEPEAFEFLMAKSSHQPKFEFEDKGVNEIFNRPLTAEEQQIIAAKQALKQQDALVKREDEEEQGPEPFLVSSTAETLAEEPLSVEVKKADPVFITPAPAIVEEPIVAHEVELQKEEQFIAAVPEKPLKLTLNELLANSRNSSTTDESPKSEISDLKQAISLNDKLLFIKDLFHGYSLAYAEVIELINKMSDFQTVDSFLQKNYAQKNNWLSKQDTVNRFYDFLHRRFPAK